MKIRKAALIGMMGLAPLNMAKAQSVIHFAAEGGNVWDSKNSADIGWSG